MPGIQDIIYEIEVGNMRKWILRAAILVLVLGLGIYYMARQFNGYNNAEAMEHGQLARSIATGEGYHSKVIRPYVLKNLRERGATNATEVDIHRMPDLVHPPGYPYLLAGFYKLTRPQFEVEPAELKDFRVYAPEQHALFLNMFLFMAALAVLYFWMLRAFDDRVALTTCFLIVVTELVWNYALSGLSFPLLMLLVCLIGFCINESLIAEEEERGTSSLVWFSLAALAVGFAMLSRYSMLALWPPLIGLAALGFQRRVPAVAVAVLIPLLLCAPWMLRNIGLVGNPFGMAWAEIFVDNGRLGGDALWRSFGIESAGLMGLRPLLRAIMLGSASLFENVGVAMGGILMPAMFLAGLFHMFKRPRSQHARWFWLASFTIAFLFAGAVLKLRSPETFPHLNGVIIFLPVLAGFGTAFLFVLIDRLRLPVGILQIPIIVLVCLLQLMPLGMRLVQHRPPPFAYPPYFPPVLILTKDWIKPNEFYASDIPWAVAWYTGRTSLWLPYKQRDFFEINDYTHPVAAILFTPYSANSRLYQGIRFGEYQDWAAIITRSEFRNLPLPAFTVLPPNKDDYLILSDFPRWKN